MREFLSVAKALSDENRVRTLMFLRSGELCVCQIIEMLGLAPSTVSKHMAVLHNAGLVESRKEGRWVYYRLSGSSQPVAQGPITWIQEALAKDRQILDDAKRIKAVKKMDKERLCAMYGRS